MGRSFAAGGLLVVCLAMFGCSSTRTASDVAKEHAQVERIREDAELARLERKQALVEQKLKATPKWALEPLRIDGDGVYAVGFGESDKAAVALKKAILEAEFGLAKKYKQELSGQERASISDRGERNLSQGYQQLIDSLVASVPMSGTEVLEQEVKAVQGQVSAWVLMKMSHQQMLKLAQRESGATEDERTRAAFAELEKRVRDRREEQLRIEERRQEMRLREMRAGTDLTRQSAQEDDGAQSGQRK